MAHASSSRNSIALLLPAIALFSGLYVAPLVFALRESFKRHAPGGVGGIAGTWSVEHYAQLFDAAYFDVFSDTLLLSAVAAALGLVTSYPIAYYVNGTGRTWLRKAIIALLVAMLFSGGVVRVYSIALTLGPVGIVVPIMRALGHSPNSIAYIKVGLVVGLLNFVIPIAAITLLGTIKNIDPRLEEAAQALGAPRWRAFVDTTLRLSVPGLVSAALLSFAVSVSAFIVPMVLGRGIIVFATSLVYSRFAEVANHPGGAAIAMVLLMLALAVVYGVMRMVGHRLRYA